MATKNLSRTVIEGGRANGNKWERYHSNGTHRSNVRDFCDKAKSLTDADELGVQPRRKKVMKAFDDKLGAVMRWLKSQVGRKWDRVFSELMTKFDTRTTAGRHVVFDHLVRQVTIKPTDIDHLKRSTWYDNYYVDEEGVLQVHRKERGRKRDRQKYVIAQTAYNWANGRRVIKLGERLFWMMPTDTKWIDCGYTSNGGHSWHGSYDLNHYTCFREHRVVERIGKVKNSASLLAFEKAKLSFEIVDGVKIYLKPFPVRQCKRGVGPYKQGARFSQADYEMWNKVSSHVQEDLLILTYEEKLKRRVR